MSSISIYIFFLNQQYKVSRQLCIFILLFLFVCVKVLVSGETINHQTAGRQVRLFKSQQRVDIH